MKQAVIIADDLTGAADTGVCFMRTGASVEIRFSPEDSIRADIVVISTESRHLGEMEARRRIRQAGYQAKEAAFVYKKIDSTLRGHPCAELAELMNVLEIEKVLVAPAYPAQDRTTVSGIQLIQGIPVENTSFQSEVSNSDLVQLFRGCNRPVRTISLNMLRSKQAEAQSACYAAGPAVIIGDAETDADLQTLVKMAIRADIRLFCGSAGLAGALADHLPAKLPSIDPISFRGRNGPILVIVGSRNPVSIDQVITARDLGIAMFELNPDFGYEQSESPEFVIHTVAPQLSLGHDVMITTSHSKDSPLGPMAVAERLANLASFFVSTQEIGGLILTGGDVAMAVIAALKASGVKLCGEFSPGIPQGILVGGTQPGLPIITKAGGFGSKDALYQAIQSLKRAAADSAARDIDAQQADFQV